MPIPPGQRGSSCEISRGARWLEPGGGRAGYWPAFSPTPDPPATLLGGDAEYSRIMTDAAHEPITIFHNPRCSKSRQALELIEAQGEPYVVIEYLQAPPDR